MMNERTNYLNGSTNPVDELNALNEMCSYLISLGKYENEEDAKKDAIHRIKFFEQLKAYEGDPSLANASIERKSVHALIYGHELHDLLVKNEGFFPESKILYARKFKHMKQFSLTYIEFIKKFNSSIDSLIGWSVFQISKLLLRRALHIKEVKNAERLFDENGCGVVISSSDNFIFLVVTIDPATNLVKKVALNIEINKEFNEDSWAGSIFAVIAIVMALDDSKLSSEEKRELTNMISDKGKKTFIRNSVEYTSMLSSGQGFVFIADPLSKKSSDLLQKISENSEYVDYDEQDLVDALKLDSQRIKKMTAQFKKEWNDLS